jgi:GNAT superfamily N-acetyltransferase
VAMEILELAPGDERLEAAFPVMHELRTHLDLENFKRLYQASHPQGYRVAAVFDGEECRACAGYRLMTNLVSGYHMYVDDLVTGEQWRSHGYGRLLNEYLTELARKEGCTSVQLDSATRRGDAHRFYFRERYTITGYHFVRLLDRKKGDQKWLS